MELIDIVTIGFFAGVVSFLLNAIFLNNLISGFLDRVQEEYEDYDDVIIDSYIEFTDNTMIMYRKDNNEFISQGSSWEELNKNTIARYPDARFNVVTEDIEKAKVFGK